ncbi:MAG TPA: VacJ family lipoprotein [Rhizomicrobium sp.]|nr:VacJ family lipoprotein [Rhizomicrobium sp.]
MWGRFPLLATALGLVLAGCAGVPGAPKPGDPGDPDEATNREIFSTNQVLDRMFLGRTARAYNATVPGFVRDRIHDLIVNLDLPDTFANDVLQGEPKRAAQTLSRLAVNAIIGLGGLFDPATRFDMPFHDEDFGQTLAVWGMSRDPYVVLPVLGPSSPRDTIGLLVDVGADPLNFIHFKQHLWWQAGREYMKVLDLRARNIRTLDDIERNSVDYYASMRSLYRQHRDSEVRNGKEEVEKLPDF